MLDFVAVLANLTDVILLLICSSLNNYVDFFSDDIMRKGFWLADYLTYQINNDLISYSKNWLIFYRFTEVLYKIIFVIMKLID